MGLVECRDLLSKDSENGLGRVAGLKLIQWSSARDSDPRLRVGRPLTLDIAGNDPRHGPRRSCHVRSRYHIVVTSPLWTLSVVEIGGLFTTCFIAGTGLSRQ
jgi:hypothetical protein